MIMCENNGKSYHRIILSVKKFLINLCTNNNRLLGHTFLTLALALDRLKMDAGHLTDKLHWLRLHEVGILYVPAGTLQEEAFYVHTLLYNQLLHIKLVAHCKQQSSYNNCL